MKVISQLVRSIYRLDEVREVANYEIRSGNLTNRGKVGSSCVGVGQFRDDPSPVIHGQQENFIELAFGNFHHLHARF